MPDYKVDTFYGLNTSVKDIKTLKAGVSPDAKNWITGSERDHIELRRGYARLHSTENTGNGKITGLGIGVRYDGVEVPFFSYDRKLNYYDSATEDLVEIGTDTLPSGANGEDVWIRPYQNLAGSFVYCGSENSGIYKIPVANPDSVVDQSITNHRFKVFHFGQNRSFAGQRNGTAQGNNDKTGLYLSYIDKALLSSYTSVSAEAYGTGDGTTVTFAHTLTAIVNDRTAMFVKVTDGTETFLDDRNGNMVGDLGGTGSVNYATGAVSVTFATAPANSQAITVDYYWESSKSTGVLDFSGSGNGQGKSFRQDDGGGNLQAIFNINTIEYCFHVLRTWQFTSSLDDTNSTNLPYRNVGIPYHRGAYQVPEGIIFADVSRANEPKIRKMEVLQGTNIQTIEPQSISDALDLSGHAFDYCVAFRWGDYEIFCVQEKVNGVANTFNSVMYIRNVISKAWDRLDYYASVLAEYNGTLIAGDSISDNVYTLFSGFDDDGDTIPNYWTSSDLNLGTDNLKKCKRMVVDGLIQPDQDIEIYVSYDDGDFTLVNTIYGDGAYVSTGQKVSIGSPTIGSKVIGGGGSSEASPFEIDFALNSDRFLFARLKIKAIGIGFVQINSFTFKDIRDKGRKNLPQRTV